MKLFTAFSVTLLTAAAAVAGGDLPAVDKSVRPGDAFFEYVNNAWLQANEIPADRSTMSDSVVLSELADRRTREIIQQTAGDRSATADAKKIADFYNAFMDGKNGTFAAGINDLGLKEGGVDFAMDDNNKDLVSPEMLAAVEKAKADIIAGTITVHDYMSDDSCPY